MREIGPHARDDDRRPHEGKERDLNESSTKTLTALLVLAGLVTGLLLGLAAITPNGANAQDRGVQAQSGGDDGTPGETTMMPPEETTTMPPPDGGDDEFGEVIIGRGSDTTYNVSLVLASLYNGAPELGVEGINPNRDIVLNAQPEGSSVGIEQLSQFAAGEDDSLATAFARSSRAPRAGDAEGLVFTSFARDGISVVTLGGGETGPSADVDNLTSEQLVDIFVTCETTNFSQLGGADAPIEVYAIQEGSGTRATFDAFLQKLSGDPNASSDNCITDPDNIVFENTLNVFDDVAPEDRANVLLPFSFGRFSTSVPDPDAKAFPIDGVEPNPQTIADRSYPLNRLVYFVTVDDNEAGGDAEANEAADGFVDFVCGEGARTENPITGNTFGEDVDNVVESNGFGLVGRCRDVVTGDARGAASVREVSAQPASTGDTP